MRAPVFLALRLVRRRSTPLLRSSAWAALAAVALGVAALVVVLALMTGYRDALRAGIMTAAGEVVLLPAPGQSPSLAAARVRSQKGVESVSLVAYLPGLLQREGGPPEVVTVKASSCGRIVPLPPPTEGGLLPVAVGKGVARRLSLREGDFAVLQAAVQGTSLRTVAVTVAHVFQTGFTELDEGWVLVSFEQLADRLGQFSGEAVEVWLSEPGRGEAARAALEEACGPGCLVTTWEENDANRALFAAVRWQKLSLGVVLSLVVLVGAFEVAAALVVLVTEKRRTLAVLLAVGAPPARVHRVVLLAGSVLGSAGVIVGLLVGMGVVALATLLGVPSFPPEIANIYMVDRIPLHLRASDVGVVLAVGVVEVVLASHLPARRAAQRDPVEVLRWV